ncbi:MAG: hypothetical protein SH807_06700 [Blastochloris sp.]|nr:hypothetical protein [Blastochloris sp.]
MQNLKSIPVFEFTVVPSWCSDAARIVEELLSQAAPCHYDCLLDLRHALLGTVNWEQTLDLFLVCRQNLELHHYLPLYRLRSLLTNRLTFEVSGEIDQSKKMSLRKLLRLNYRSVSALRSAFDRESFEHQLNFTSCNKPAFRIVEV